MMFLVMMFLLTVWSFMSSSPQKASLLLMIQVVLISYAMFYYLNAMWLAYIFFMVMVGGLLILFLYLCGLAANNKYSKLKFNLVVGGFLVFMTGFSFPSSINPNVDFNEYSLLYTSTSKLFFYSNIKIYLFLVVYLLLALIVVVMIMKKSNTPLRLLPFFG